MSDPLLSAQVPGRDPWKILGVQPGSGPEATRAAYLAKVKEHPPDRSPAEFEQVRDAYSTLSDPRRRAEHLILAADPGLPLEALLAGRQAPRQRADLKLWLDVLEGSK